ncbi:T9SS C-terminal target domain-containing protein [Dokdonia sinensis]|uniref:T9SS C-terminal target domain-containing protein n=1 Tax=Dokdonia sinensis TaxID=2479847 RepID=A0A3M0FZ15_9FLAO|nr:M4 family metallopeptidase [Dokdonia sinensis]RMB57137.1 T9SS C-terminal target domain-containing protein [Dokdonia sinensis]
MMKNYLKSFTLLFALLIYSSTLYSQEVNKSSSVIHLDGKTIFNSTDSKGALLSLTKTKGDKFKFIKKSESTDELGFKIEKYSSSYNGIPIAFSTTTVISKDGVIKKVINDLPDMNVYNTDQNFIAKTTAFLKAKDAFPSENYAWEDSEQSKKMGYTKPEGTLTILPKLAGISDQSRAVYAFDMMSLKPVNREVVYIDAVTGDFVFSKALIYHQDTPAQGQSVYNGLVQFTAREYIPGNYELRNTSLGAEIETKDAQGSLAFNAAPVTSTSTVFNNQSAVQAHFGMESAYNYFKNEHNRNSFDGNGTKIRSTVNTADFGYVNNAFWYQDQIYFTRTSGTSNPLSHLEVAGHELSHGVVQYSASLIYSNESGQLNESFADIFGFMSKYKAINVKDWEIGRGLDPAKPTEGFRNMENPNIHFDPKFYHGTHWTDDPFNLDNGGVHTNSGVQNHWFYLITEGQSGTNEVGNTYNITGIGPDKAAAIAYRNLTVYLSPSSQYHDSRVGSIEAARDLYGIGSPEEIAVTDAWHTVGVGPAYGQTSITCGPADVIFEIDIDGNPQDIMLYVIDQNGGLVVGAGPGSFENEVPGTTYVSQPLALPSLGSYKIHIYDLDGDGLTTGGYSGGFRMKDLNGNILMELNNFDFSKGAEYCVGNAGTRVFDFEQPVGPSYFNLTSVSDTTADFEWGTYTDNVAVVASYLYLNKQIQPYYAGNTGTITGLLPCTTYTVVAFATDPDNNVSSPGGKITFTTTGASCDSQAPSIPINLVANNVAEQSLDLSWDASVDNVGVAGYKVFQDGVQIADVSSNAATVTGLITGTAYGFEVLAYDGAGNESAKSAVLNITTAASSCAQSLQLEMTFGTNPEFLQWIIKDANYVVVKASANGQYYNQTPGSSLTENIDISTLPDGDYNFIFVDFGSNGTSYELKDGNNVLTSGSNIIYGQTDQICLRVSNGDTLDLIPPSTITDLSLVSNTATEATLSWTPATDNEGIFSQLLLVNGSVWANIWQAGTNQYTIGNLTPGITYNFEILTWDVGGNFSGESNTVTATTQGAMTSVTLNQGYFETSWDGWIDGGWDAHRRTDARSLEGNRSIRLRDNSGQNSSMISPTFDLTAYDYMNFEFLVHVFSFEGQENFFLEFNNGSGWQVVSNFVNNVEIFNNGDFQMNATIRNSDFAFSQNSRLRLRCDASGNGDQIFVDATLIEGITGGNLPSTSGTVVTTLGANSIKESNDVIEYDEIIVYPNPVQNTFELKGLTEEDFIQISVYDMKGSLVKTFNDYDQSYDISTLQAGVYIVRCTMIDGEETNQRLIKK